MKHLVALCLVLGSLFAGFAQPMQLLVKKGTVTIDASAVPAGKLTPLTDGVTVKVAEAALALVRRGDDIKELQPAKEYTYTDINGLFEEEQQFAQAFIQVIMQQNYQLRKNSGVSMRGDDDWYYAPADSLLVISDSLHLVIGSSTSILNTPITLFAVGGTDTLHIPAPNREATIALPPAGVYTWQYTLQNNDLIGDFQNVFIVPTQEERIGYRETLATFQSSIAAFSAPMQQQLLAEFLVEKGWYVGRRM